MKYTRLISQNLQLPASVLLFGPRQTGKTSVIKELALLKSIDLLLNKNFLKYNKNPDILYQEVQELAEKTGRIAIDEIQKVPALLDVVHKIVEEHKEITFILSGSSARKLKRGAANLLGGRAIDLKLHPLSYFEIPAPFPFEKILQFGSLPKIYDLVSQGQQALASKLLSSYVSTYLKEEIKSEALVRNLPGSQRFLDFAASVFAKQTNLTEAAIHAGVSDRTIKEYYSILEDTLIGFFLEPYHLSAKQRLSKTPKFYFFDNGVTRAINGSVSAAVENIEKGYLFEQYVVQEIRRMNDYFDKNLKLYFWRTASGSEVDLLLIRENKPVLAIECKSSASVTRSDMSGLVAILSEFSKIQRVLCAPVSEDRVERDGIRILRPERVFELIRDL